ncbi:hypothetical protein B0O41_3348 [Propionibacteriaceae bacterium ES.041]|nr:hypothetical protein B0O41_3348 [Propionibacteriaceae bacterium ES.041]
MSLADQVRSALAGPQWPLPGHGHTAERWQRLADLARTDIVVGRLVEAHADATAILTELGRTELLAPGQWWGVWAAEPPRPVVRAQPDPEDPDRLLLDGAKPWCSGAGLCDHALITVRDAADPDRRLLAAVELTGPGVRVEEAWANPGMTRSATHTVHLDQVPATRVGSGVDYLDRAGFWHGGAGVAACWAGGAEAVADTLRGSRRDDPITLAHLGAVDAALAGARWTLAAAAAEVDAAPEDASAARIRALRVRAIVEAAAALTIDRVGRALGAGPLCQDAEHARAVADLSIYLRQSHAERDLAGLGELVRR